MDLLTPIQSPPPHGSIPSYTVTTPSWVYSLLYSHHPLMDLLPPILSPSPHHSLTPAQSPCFATPPRVPVSCSTCPSIMSVRRRKQWPQQGVDKRNLPSSASSPTLPPSLGRASRDTADVSCPSPLRQPTSLESHHYRCLHVRSVQREVGHGSVTSRAIPPLSPTRGSELQRGNLTVGGALRVGSSGVAALFRARAWFPNRGVSVREQSRGRVEFVS
ncbi:hypothetical protein BaRGS_00003365 [Batillaria attramentaria]|uniref:Uncharacterized protein n=1 Tax=Batillaria attramentaria TaxID=370345 RepID=A0ABD0M1N2_9CAEN